MFVPYNTEKIRLAYKSKCNTKRKNQVILLMITDGKKWHYLAVKSLSALIRGITSKYDWDIYCLNCFHSYIIKNKLEKHGRVCNYYDYCYVEISDENNKILKHNHGEKSIKAPSIIYGDLQCLLKKMHSCQNNPEKSYTEKTLHKASGYSIFTNCSFDSTKNKLDCYRGKDYMERFCKGLRKHATEITDYEKKRNDTANWWRK